MLPDHTLSNPAVFNDFLAPRNLPKQPLADQCYGGTDIDDAGAGLFSKVWTASYIGPDIMLSAAGVAPFILATIENLANLSLAFDQDMRPAIAYEFASGGSAFRWYDPDEADYVTLDLPGALSPRVAIDTANNAGLPDSDVILTYIRSGTLYAREQRDAFAVEYALRDSMETFRINRFGRNSVNRMQWEIILNTTGLPSPVVPTVFQAMDIPALVADDVDSAPLLYLAAAGTLNSWPGAVVEISRDGGTTWEPLASITTPAIIGELVNPLADHTDASPDETNTLRVRLFSFGATLTSTDADGLAQLFNSALVGDEELQFRDVVQVDADEWDLSYLLRGVDGTAHAAHLAGARFVFLDPAALVIAPLDVGDVGEVIKVRARTIGGSVLVVQTLTFEGLAGP